MLKIMALVFALVPQMVSAQKEIDLYGGHVPNSKDSVVRVDTSAYNEVYGKRVLRIKRLQKGVVRPTLTVYLPGKNKANGTAIIICPGGSYKRLAISHEGSEIAKWLAAEGIAAFVLKYRVPTSGIMVDKKIGPLQDAQRAIQLVRENAAALNIDPTKIGILGSSAGGHVASTAGTHWQKALISNPNNTSLRPDFMILNYAVISFTDSLAHYGSRVSLVGPEKVNSNSINSYQALGIDESTIRFFSNELHITSQTPPAFITTLMSDKYVRPENSLYFAESLKRHNVAVEVFVYEHGEHGFGLNNPEEKEQWTDRCIIWLKKEKWRK